ncbi:MAG: hypothetical protein JW821_08055 [Deltaproteobacteria bacterium]|nr:hypothetical protein [Deltaproteobacteria bacterium]
MDKDDPLLIGIKKRIRDTEVRAAESILRWKDRKEGKAPKGPDAVARRGEALTDRAHEIIRHRGKNIWEEFKRACLADRNRKDRGK